MLELSHTLTQHLTETTEVMAAIIGYIGIGIIVYGSLKCVAMFLWCSVCGSDKVPLIRLDLGKHLALGLEFLVGKDVIESVVSPSWTDLGKLGVIILLRTMVTVMLSMELKEVKEELEQQDREKKRKK